MLLITDLDNTLYDWVDFFAKSFSAMVGELAALISVPETRLREEFKELHQRYGDSERPFTILELPAVRRHFGDLPPEEMRRKLERPLTAFSETRLATLRLYPQVRETLLTLKGWGVPVVGHTEAMAVNAYYRLQFLGITELFDHLYSLESFVAPHPRKGGERDYTPPAGFMVTLPRSARKPNPELLLTICCRQGVAASEAWYVGDSLTRDVSMAKSAGLRAVWARYGSTHDPALWDVLVSVTHWTAADVAREAELRHRFDRIEPDVTIDSFGELLPLVADAIGARDALRATTMAAGARG
jgi:phosphoglycolate phosphatase